MLSRELIMFEEFQIDNLKQISSISCSLIFSTLCFRSSFFCALWLPATLKLHQSLPRHPFSLICSRNVTAINYYTKTCEPKKEKKCEHHYEDKCHTTYKEECTYEKKQECETVYKTKTTYEKKQECHTTYTEECKPTYNYEKNCKKIPHQSCKYIDVPKHEHVPEQKCHYINVPHCKKVPYQDCKKVPEEQCHYINTYQPGKEKHQECQKEVRSYKTTYKTDLMRRSTLCNDKHLDV